MERHFHTELKELKQSAYQMGQQVQTALQKSLASLFDRNANLAQAVVDEDAILNQMEIEIDRKGHNLSALGQPVAQDLRLITSLLKINTDLERIGDHCVNIAERVLLIMEEPPLESKSDLPAMATLTAKMFSDALQSFSSEDPQTAQALLERDDEIDSLNDSLFFDFEELMEKKPEYVRVCMNLIMVAHNLERIADLTNNIAENIIYLKLGKEVRHHSES
ncbi:MAG: phosphate signaling complex protein PhoU [Candidatus Omnitrophica bacterium]|nr:phosphate signaling complex protein PhoU [Candidatus Omnitrophota bacterium]